MAYIQSRMARHLRNPSYQPFREGRVYLRRNFAVANPHLTRHANDAQPLGYQPTRMIPVRSFTSSTGKTTEAPAGEKHDAKREVAVDNQCKPKAGREAAIRAVKHRRAIETATKASEKEVDQKDYQKRYNTAARKWVSTMIALPILFVTSYYLFDRRTSETNTVQESK